jgi:hypothetical protein
MAVCFDTTTTDRSVIIIYCILGVVGIENGQKVVSLAHICAIVMQMHSGGSGRRTGRKITLAHRREWQGFAEPTFNQTHQMLSPFIVDRFAFE